MLPIFNINFRDQESNTSYRPGLALDKAYNEEKTARGAVFHFQKHMSYTSGFRRRD